jgi:hypothetical protein
MDWSWWDLVVVCLVVGVVERMGIGNISRGMEWDGEKVTALMNVECGETVKLGRCETCNS